MWDWAIRKKDKFFGTKLIIEMPTALRNCEGCSSLMVSGSFAENAWKVEAGARKISAAPRISAEADYDTQPAVFFEAERLIRAPNGGAVFDNCQIIKVVRNTHRFAEYLSESEKAHRIAAFEATARACGYRDWASLTHEVPVEKYAPPTLDILKSDFDETALCFIHDGLPHMRHERISTVGVAVLRA